MAKRLLLIVVVSLVAAGCGLAYEDAGTTTTTTTLAVPTAVPTGPADIVFSDQKVEGTVVTVDSVSMPAPGFVVLRLDADGIPGDVIGVGDVLARGVVAEVEIPLFVPLTDDIVVHAELHVDVDEDGVFTYQPPDDVIDVPATRANGEAASASALIQLLPPLGPAEIAFGDQRSDGDSVVVASVTLPAAGFIGIWTSDEGEPGVLIGRSALLPETTSTDVTIDLVPAALETAPLIAAVHVDRDENATLVPGDTFDPLAETIDGLPAYATAFVTVVRLGPVDVSVGSEQDDEEGDTLATGAVTMSAPGFVTFSIDGDVVATTDLLAAGITESLSLTIDPLGAGEYDVTVRVYVDFDGDEALTDFDPEGRDEAGRPFEASFVLTVPEPPVDEDA